VSEPIAREPAAPPDPWIAPTIVCVIATAAMCGASFVQAPLEASYPAALAVSAKP
jgi:hypothetical protein